MYLNANGGYNGIQPNPNLNGTNGHLLSADTIFEHLNGNAIERYLGRELNRQAVELIFARDAIVRKVVTAWGQWMSLAPWEIQADDPDLAAYLRDAIDAMNLVDWLGEAYTFSTIYEDSYLVIPTNFYATPEILGVAHAGNAWKNQEGFYQFSVAPNERVRAGFYDDQLIRIESSDSLSRFYFEYERYVTAIEQIASLIPVSELLICNQEDLSNDLKRMDESQQRLFVAEKIDAIRSGAYNKGVILGDEALKVQLLHRKLEEIMRGLDALEIAMISASGLPEAYVRGASRTGTGLAAIDEYTKAAIAQGTDSRRKLHWTKIFNWVIGILLERIGENPRAASVKWVSSYQIDPEKLASVDEKIAKTDNIYIDTGVLTSKEVRTSRFSGKIKSKEVFIPQESSSKKYQIPEELETSTLEKPESINTENPEYSPTESSYAGVGNLLEYGFGDGELRMDMLGVVIRTDAEYDEEIRDLWRRYKASVNMTYSEMLRWSKDRRSNLASVDRSPIRRNLQLLAANYEQFKRSRTLQKYAKMTISFNARMRKVPNGKVIKNAGLTPRNIALLNWAYNPYKAAGTTIPRDPKARGDESYLIPASKSNKDKSNKVSVKIGKDELELLRTFLYTFRKTHPKYKDSVSLTKLIEVYSAEAGTEQQNTHRVEKYLWELIRS